MRVGEEVTVFLVPRSSERWHTVSCLADRVEVVDGALAVYLDGKVNLLVAAGEWSYFRTGPSTIDAVD